MLTQREKIRNGQAGHMVYTTLGLCALLVIGGTVIMAVLHAGGVL